MKKVLYFFCLACICLSGCKESLTPTLEEEGIHGRVQSIMYLCFSGKNRFDDGLITIKEPENNGLYYCTYDSDGYITCLTNYDVDKFYKSYEEFLDSLGNEIKHTSYNEYGEKEYSTQYSYDQHNNVVCEIDLLDYTKTKTKNFYNTDGLLIKSIDDYTTHVYSYDLNGRLSRHEERDFDGRYVDEYFYDENGNETLRIWTTPEGNKRYHYRTYDEKNRVVRWVISEDPEQNIIFKKVDTSYLPDGHKDTEWDSEGNVKDVTIRHTIKTDYSDCTISLNGDEQKPMKIQEYIHKGQSNVETFYHVQSDITNKNYFDWKNKNVTTKSSTGRIIKTTPTDDFPYYHIYDGEELSIDEYGNWRKMIIKQGEKYKVIYRIIQYYPVSDLSE